MPSQWNKLRFEVGVAIAILTLTVLQMVGCSSLDDSPFMNELKAISEERSSLENEAKDYWETHPPTYLFCKSISGFTSRYGNNFEKLSGWYLSYEDELDKTTRDLVLEQWSAQERLVLDSMMTLTTTVGPCLQLCRTLTGLDGDESADPCVLGTVWSGL